MTPSERRKQERTVRNLAHKIRSLSRELRSAQSRGRHEVRRVREGGAKMLKGMRAATDSVKLLHASLATVAESLEGVGYDALIRFGRALGARRWARLWWGIRFGITGRA